MTAALMYHRGRFHGIRINFLPLLCDKTYRSKRISSKSIPNLVN